MVVVQEYGPSLTSVPFVALGSVAELGKVPPRELAVPVALSPVMATGGLFVGAAVDVALDLEAKVVGDIEIVEGIAFGTEDGIDTGQKLARVRNRPYHVKQDSYLQSERPSSQNRSISNRRNPTAKRLDKQVAALTSS
jgi:hypothetical protein